MSSPNLRCSEANHFTEAISALGIINERVRRVSSRKLSGKIDLKLDCSYNCRTITLWKMDNVESFELIFRWDKRSRVHRILMPATFVKVLALKDRGIRYRSSCSESEAMMRAMNSGKVSSAFYS